MHKRLYREEEKLHRGTLISSCVLNYLVSMKSNINPGNDHCNADRGHENDEDEELLETSKDPEMSRRTFSMREMTHNSALEGAGRRAFSMSALSTSGGGSGYQRIELGHQFQCSWDVNADHDHEQHVNFIGARLDKSAMLQMKPTKIFKKRGSNILEACKRLFGF